MKKETNSRWIKKLTDDNILELVKRLSADKPAKKFVKIIKIERKDDQIEVVYESKKLKSYLTYAEDKFTINDFKVNGSKLNLFATTMTEFFGEEYAEEFLSCAEKYISENKDDVFSKRYEKAIKDVNKQLNCLNQSNNI